jgi:hypothetical protein
MPDWKEAKELRKNLSIFDNVLYTFACSDASASGLICLMVPLGRENSSH